MTLVIPSAADAVTAMELSFPVMEGVTVSVAVMDSLPTVCSTAEKFPVPFVRAEFAGSRTLALVSLLVK